MRRDKEEDILPSPSLSHGMVALVASSGEAQPLRLEDAEELFRPHLPCENPKQLRRVYLQLALRYHPDKCHGNCHGREDEVSRATELFQAIAAVYERLLKLLKPGETGALRVKSQVAAAAELGDLEELERLLKEDPQRAVELDDLGVCPLMFAAAGGQLDAIRLLLSYGADVLAKNPINWTVTLYACLGNHGDVVRWLVSAGTKVTAHELILTAYTGNSEGLAALIDLFQEGKDGGTLRTLDVGSSYSRWLSCKPN